MVEQLLMRGKYRRRIVDSFSTDARSYLIDVDLVRGRYSITYYSFLLTMLIAKF